MKNKKIFLNSFWLFMILCSMQGFSQQTATAPSFTFPPTPSPLLQEYKARDFVKLQPGFSYTATAGNTFRAWIDESLIPPVNTNPSYPITETDPILDIDTVAFPVVANIPGNAGVSGSGAATYQIPIGMPPGTKGMVPNLSIVYNSQGGNGIMGLGWDISGISAITRISQTYYKNGNKKAVDLSTNDRFAMDGIRLVQTLGTVYGADNAEYHTENENFSKIISHGNVGTGPAWFEVKTTDGTTIEYGNINPNATSADSRFIPGGSTVFSWHINKITDKFGNYILFKYRTVNGEHLIDQIEYTGNTNASLLPYNKIKFYYEEKNEKALYYVGGVIINQNLLLSKIKVYAEDQIRDEYTFDYFYDKALINDPNALALNVTKLKKISLKVNNQTDINATKILWYDNSLNFQTHTYDNIPFLNTNYSSRKTVSGDFDGDGIDEILVIDGFFNPYSSIVAPDWYGKHWAIYKVPTVVGTDLITLASGDDWPSSPTANVISIYSCDMNMDGKDEIYVRSLVKTEATPTSNTYYTEYNLLYKFSFSSGNGNISLVSNNGYATDNNTSYNFKSTDLYYCPWHFQLNEMLNRRESKIFDYNGDGKPDFFVVYRNAGGTSQKDQIKIYLNTGNGFNSSLKDIDINFVNSSSNLDRVEIVDFNGDGKSEIMVIRKYAQIGYTDLCNTPPVSVHNLCVVYEYKAESNPSCNPFNVIYNENYPTQYDKFFTGDFNGDGKTDMLRWEAGSWQKLYNNGTNSFDWTPITITSIPSYSSSNCYFVTDWDHDGKDDFISFHNNGVWVYLSKGENFIAKLGACSFSLEAGAPISDACAYPSEYNGMMSSDIVLGDYTGYNNTDIFGWTSYNKLIPQILFYKLGNPSNFVEAIFDGFKNYNLFTYTPLTKSAIYTKGTNSVFPIMDVQPPSFVVSGLSFVNNSDHYRYNQNIYSYQGLKHHITDNKILGFTKMTVINRFLGSKVESIYELKGSFNQPMLAFKNTYANTTSDPNNLNWEQISSDSIINSVIEYPSSTNVLSLKRAFYYPLKSYSFDLINDIKKESEYINGPLFGSTGMDEGTIITNTKTYNSISSTASFEETTNEVTKVKPSSYSTWFPSKVTYEKTTQTLTGFAPYSRSKKYEYYADDKLQYVTGDDLNNDYNVKLEYTQYNNFGISEVIKTNPPFTNPYLLEVLTQTNTYDSKGRFLIEEKNTLNHTTKYSYEPKFGNIIETIDLNGLETKFEYDNIGRKKKTIFPDNTEESIVYYWAFGSPYPLNSLYKTIASSTDNPNLTTLYDALGRAFRTETINFNNQSVLTTTIYNLKGQVTNTSLPYLNVTVPDIKNTTYTYDYLGRKKSETNPDASFTNIIYSPTVYRQTIVQTGGNGIASQNQETKVNCIGQNEYVMDNNSKKVNYTYNSAGQLTESWVGDANTPSNQRISMTYNLLGNQTSVNDPDAGLTTTIYDAYGQLREQKDGKQNANSLTPSTYSYDILGRLVTVSQTEGPINYYYITSTPNIGKLDHVTGWNGTNNKFIYDALGRNIQSTEEITEGGTTKSFSLTTSYDVLTGRVKTITYPENNLVIKYDYLNGQLSAVKRINGSNETNIWQANSKDLIGNYNSYTSGFGTNAWTTTKTFNQNNGRLSKILTGTTSHFIQNFDYTYDAIGNLTSRKENFPSHFILTYQKEDFTYNNLNQLNGITYYNDITLPVSKPITYDAAGLGNITQIPGVGDFTYDTHQLHAITQINNNPGNINTEQIATYTSFNKILRLQDSPGDNLANRKLDFTYGPDYSRRKTAYYVAGATTPNIIKYFALDCYEEETNTNTGVTVKDYYINGGNGIAAIYRITGANPGVMYYIHKDNIGSFDKVTDQQGNVVENYSFDAWGNRTGNIWNDAPDVSTYLFSRGFTGHEHLDKFGLINMNGRLYDPKLARFLSPDPVLQDPSNTQNYNRYSYCLNNPFAFTDPSGFEYAENVEKWNIEQESIDKYNAYLAWKSYDEYNQFVIDYSDRISYSGIDGSYSENGFNSISIRSVDSYFEVDVRKGLTEKQRNKYQRNMEFYNSDDNKQNRDLNDKKLKEIYKDKYNLKEGDCGIQIITTRLDKKYVSTGVGLTDDNIFINLKNGARFAGQVSKAGYRKSNIYISPGRLNDKRLNYRDATLGHELIHAYHNYAFENVNNRWSENVAHTFSYSMTGDYISLLHILNNSIGYPTVPNSYQHIPYIYKFAF